MAMASPDVFIETKHGDNCTCPSVGDVHIELVVARSNCPGDHSPHRAGSIDAQLAPHKPVFNGAVIITWPSAAKPPVHGAPLMPWRMEIHDHATGEQMLGINKLRMVIGGDSWDDEMICVDLTELVGEDGKPLRGKYVVPVRDPDDPDRIRTGVFRYLVAEMRIKNDDPHEIHLVGWDGPIERLELRYKSGAEVGADWGRRIAEAARNIVSEQA